MAGMWSGLDSIKDRGSSNPSFWNVSSHSLIVEDLLVHFPSLFSLDLRASLVTWSLTNLDWIWLLVWPSLYTWEGRL